MQKSSPIGLRRCALVAALLAFSAMPADATGPGASKAPADEVFYSTFPDDAVMMTHGGQLERRIPPGIAGFDEPAVKGGAAFLHKLRDRKTGEVVGFGTQLEAMVKDDRGRMSPEWPTSWTLVLPGRGTLFLYEIENVTKLSAGREKARAGPQPWPEPVDERTTVGPLPTGEGIIVGGAGEFAGRQGTFVESDKFTADDPKSAMGVRGELELRITFAK